MWEYRASTIPQEYFMLDDILKSYSQTDWELVTIIPTHSRHHDGKYISLVFKRQPSIRDAAWADLEMDGDFVVHGPWGTTRFDSDEDKLDFTEFVQNLQKGE